MWSICVSLGLLTCTLALPLRESSYDAIEERSSGKVKFYLYTRRNPDTPQQLFIGDLDSVKCSNFEPNHQTKIIIHGWGSSYTTTPNTVLREAYFSKNDSNVISIDWHEYAKLNYVSARAKVHVAGGDIAEFLDFLNEKFYLDFDKLVVIGHSLGAHVAGFTGKQVKRGVIAAIVGLDPAYPLYSYKTPSKRLASTDAKYVQSIQTNGNVNGFLKPIGSATFYPNWGRSQPGCGSDLYGNCSHGRSVAYYAESIRGYSFATVYKCNNIVNITNKGGCDTLEKRAEMGDPLEIQRVNGLFYLTTNENAPFGQI